MLNARQMIGVLVLAAASVGLGCASTGKCGCGSKCECGASCKCGAPKSAAKPINTICPIGGHEVDPSLTATYKGQTIAFCCDSCSESFAKMSDEKKAETVAKAAKKP